MNIFAVGLALIVLVAGSAFIYLKFRLANVSDNKDLEAAIDSEVGKLTRNDPLFGMVVGVYKGKQTLIKGYGALGQGGAAVPDASSVFQIASVSKLFTASLLQILCEEGALTMDASLGELIGDSVPLSPEAQGVTLRQLVTHTSGFPSIPKPLGLLAIKLAGKDAVLQNPYSHLGPQHMFDYLATSEGKRESGRFEYSNFGMGLLGHVLEKVMNRSFESLVFEKLLAPLGMSNTGVTLTPNMKSHLAPGHTAKGEPAPMWTFSALAGAGAFNANVEDMMRFVRANIEDDAPLARTLKKCHQPQLGGTTGIGWMQPTFMDRFFGNRTVVWHNGMVGGYASYVSIDTESKTGVVVLFNKAVDVTMLGMMLTRQARIQSWAPKTVFR